MEPLVSVVVPIFNRSELLSDIIRTISEQTYKEFEVIIVDDGSVPPVELEPLYNTNFEYTLLRLDSNHGAGYARRKGREIAKGDYICYLDSDDWWSNNFIELCVLRLKSDEELGMVYTNTIRYKDGAPVSERVQAFNAESILPYLFNAKKRIWSTPSCMWRREVSLPQNWYAFRNYEDYLHDILASIQNNKIAFVKGALTYNNHSANNRTNRNNAEVAKAINTIIKLDQLPIYKGILYFVMDKLYEFNVRVRFNCFWYYFRLPFKLNRLKYSQYTYYYILLFLIGLFGIKSYKVKNLIEKLK